MSCILIIILITLKGVVVFHTIIHIYYVQQKVVCVFLTIYFTKFSYLQ